MPSSREGKRDRWPIRSAAAWSADMPTRMLAPSVLRGWRAGEKGRHGTGMIAGPIAVGVGLVAHQPADHHELVLQRRQRTQRRRQLVVAPEQRASTLACECRWAHRSRPAVWARQQFRQPYRKPTPAASPPGRECAIAVPTPRRKVLRSRRLVMDHLICRCVFGMDHS